MLIWKGIVVGYVILTFIHYLLYEVIDILDKNKGRRIFVIITDLIVFIYTINWMLKTINKF